MADPTLSLCMIVKNEEAYLADCLTSAQPFVDEIIVVDTGSTDRTVALAERFKAKMFHFQWCEDFAAARNESLRHATGDWILVLDADERIDEAGGREIQRLITDRDAVGYYLKLVCPTQNDGGIVRLGWFPRLFRNRIGAHFKGIVHEQVAPSLAGKGKVAHADVTIRHEGYMKSPEEMAAKAVRNIRLLERQVHENPEHALGWFHLAEAYTYANRLSEAESGYRKSLALSVLEDLTYSDGIAALAMQNLGATLIQQGKLDEGVRELTRASEFLPTLPSIHVHLGDAYLRKGQFEEAIHALTHAIHLATKPVEEGETPDVQMTPWLAWLLLGSAQARLGRRQEALWSFQQAYRLKPDLRDAYWLRGLTALEDGCPAIAVEDLESARRLGRDDANLWVALGGAKGNLGDLLGAAEAFREALSRSPDSATARFNLCRALKGLGRWEDLLIEGQQLLEASQGSPELYRLLAESCQTLRAWAEGAAMYEALLSLVDQPLAEDLLGLSICWYESGEIQKALETIDRALSSHSLPQFWMLRGHCYLRSGNAAAALQAYQSAAQVPDSARRTSS
ncbi:MAG TPA: glycosyltransferase [Methylomirabilota bacterium]|nr:glycosyltransferase [Methylomirabilota bacterium]